MSGVLWRILFVVVCVILLNLLLQPVLHLLGISLDGDILTIVRVCVAGLALFYIIWGPPSPPWVRP